MKKANFMFRQVNWDDLGNKSVNEMRKGFTEAYNRVIEACVPLQVTKQDKIKQIRPKWMTHRTLRNITQEEADCIRYRRRRTRAKYRAYQR
ncbi:hypothetical protein SK128_000609, partial [Halocaridina rubra]